MDQDIDFGEQRGDVVAVAQRVNLASGRCLRESLEHGFLERDALGFL